MILNILMEIEKYLEELSSISIDVNKKQDAATYISDTRFNIIGNVENFYEIKYNNADIDTILENITKNISEISENNEKKIVNAITMIQEEIKKEKPNKNVIRSGIDVLTSMMQIVNGIPDLKENIIKVLNYIREGFNL